MTVAHTLTCRRRVKNKSGHPAYQTLLMDGQTLPRGVSDSFAKMAWWHECKSKDGVHIFVMAPRGPWEHLEKHVDMWKFISYCVCQLHSHVVSSNKSYSIILFQFNTQRMWTWSMISLKRQLHPRYVQNLKSLHVVHPSWSLRMLGLVLWPVAEDELWDWFVQHERVEFLHNIVDLKNFALPGDIYKYDKFLDEEARSQKPPTHSGFGGSGGMFGSFDTSALNAQREELDKQMSKLDKLTKSRNGKRD